MKKLLLLMVLAAFAACSENNAASEYETKTIAENLDTPWEILWGPDDYIWMTERRGVVSRVNPETGSVIRILTINEVIESGESGLLGMALHPNFLNTPYVFLVYNYDDGGIKERLVRYEFSEGELVNPEILLENIPGASIHDGSRLWIDDKNKLFMTTGDAANASLAQNIESLNGKILRLNLDGSIPDDNPDPESPVWSRGHRNPQGLVVVNGIMYSSEHGPASDDEVNIIEKGRNYGWPDVMGFCDSPGEETFCEEHNVKEPIAAWTPTLAVAGLDFYKGLRFPDLDYSLLMVNLKAARIVQMKLSGDGRSVVEENHLFVNEFGRLRDICISPQDRIFFSTSNRDGRGAPAQNDDRIIEILPKASSTAQSLAAPAEAEVFIFPNPANDLIKISFGSKRNTGNIIKIFNSIGNEVMDLSNNGSNHSYSKSIDISNLSQGVYRIVIENGGKYISRQFSVVR